MRITERELRKIIRGVIKESVQNADLLRDYQRKLSAMNIEYSYCDNEFADETSCGFIVNGKHVDFEGMIFPSEEDIFNRLLYSIFPELEDLEDYDLDEKVIDEIKTKLGKGLEKLHRDLGVSSSDASNYMTREVGDDDEYNPY
jgi:hypothetical protein